MQKLCESEASREIESSNIKFLGDSKFLIRTNPGAARLEKPAYFRKLS